MMSVIKKVLLPFVLVMLSAGVVMAGLSDTTGNEAQEPSLTEVLERGNHKKFLWLLREGKQEALLQRDGITLLVPSEDTLESLGDERLKGLASDSKAMQEFIDNHVVSGRVTLSDMMSQGKMVTVAGDTLEIEETEEGLTCGGLPVLQADQMSKTAVVHVVDGAFVPASHAPAESPIEFLEDQEMQDLPDTQELE